MRTRFVLAVALSFLAAVVVLAQAETKMASKGGGHALVAVPAADLKWMDLDPNGAPGVKSADVWGDHNKGAFKGFTKFPAGFVAPLHTHTHDMRIAVVSGTFIHTPEGKPEIRLGPGSYMMQPGGGYRHTTACDKAAECVFFIESDGKFDLIPAKEGKAPAAKK